MSQTPMPQTRSVITFSKREGGMPMPHLLDIQTQAFRTLLVPDDVHGQRQDVSLERVFRDLFPITDVNEKYKLEFLGYALGEAKYSVEECIERDMTYAAPLKARLRLDVYEDVEGQRRLKNAIEKEVYLGELPIMTPLGTFVINGAERVVVSQLHRSPGVVFEEDTHPNGQRLFSARIIPFRGSWVEFTIDIHDVIYVHIDKKKKFPATALLRAFGYGTNADILKLFYATKDIDITGKLEGRAQKREVLGTLLAADVPDPENKKGEPLGKVGDELTLEKFNTFRRAGISKVKVFAGYTSLDLRDEAQPTSTRERQGSYVLAFDAADPETGEVLAEGGRELSDTLKKKLLKAGVTKMDVLLPAGRSESPLIKNTLLKDPTHTEAEALEQIYALLRPGEAPNLETARQALERLFFHPKRYDLGRGGRYKINQRLNAKVPKHHTALTEDDLIAISRYLIEMREGRGYTDDIDHLGNRRVRSVGELIANQFSVGLSRMARLIKERMSINNDPERITLDDLVNARTVSAVIQAFFGSSQLSKFMDQTNPLAELTHKRRLSALGPGGLTRERAGFEVRDVHYSQYGRMCPIETPEGPNIGLITSLACYARVNDLGFVETPYRVVRNGKVTSDLEWLDANKEEDKVIAQANAALNSDGSFLDELVLARQNGDVPLTPADRIEYMDVAPEQLVSIAAALIPFLEHDDANRAIMGSNMQRQAVPLLNPKTPFVGTGLEEKVAVDSGAVVIAKRSGVVSRVTADEIIVDAGPEELRRAAEDGRVLARLTQHDRYKLRKYWRTNQDTAINQRPLVKLGQAVKVGDVLADGAATEMGQLALGANVVVAFMPWYGHNFEDAIVLSERLVKDARDAELGELLEGETVALALKSGTVEEAIPAGTKLTAGVLRDLRISSLDLKTFRVADKKVNDKIRAIIDAANDEKAKLEEKAEERIDRILQPDELPPGVIQLVKVYLAEKRKISVGDKMAGRHGNKGIVARIVPEEDMPFLPDGRPVDIVLNPLGVPSRMNVGQILETHLGWAAKLLGFYAKTPVFQGANEKEIGLLLKIAGLTWVRDALELKTPKLEVGDADVKSILANVKPERVEGGKVTLLSDASLNDLGARGMSQATRDVYHRIRDFIAAAAKELVERESTATGHELTFHQSDDPELTAARKTEYKAAVKQLEKAAAMAPADVLAGRELGALGAMLGRKSDADVDAAAGELLPLSGITPFGKVRLRDGRSGETFAAPVTVGAVYMLKLSHLVDDKIHARSIGPYSLVTQQPLAGKAQFGGQRFGEMEVWALEAYGAAHVLQEILTVKSDDVNGRSRVYEAIVKGQNLPEPGIPESFNVLVK